MALHRAWLNAHQLGGGCHGAASGNERGQGIDLARRGPVRWLAAKLSVPHASRLAAASHSSRPSIGIV